MRNEEKQARAAERAHAVSIISVIARQSVIDALRKYYEAGMSFEKALEIIQEVQDELSSRAL